MSQPVSRPELCVFVCARNKTACAFSVADAKELTGQDVVLSRAGVTKQRGVFSHSSSAFYLSGSLDNRFFPALCQNCCRRLGNLIATLSKPHPRQHKHTPEQVNTDMMI